ncbi:MAG: LPS export ABC transporter permease LptG [Gammaproteobacteria bacterium]|nr:LPS export ABC transporter permease LptG [Gammaproteobacteria bacterium]
MKLAWYFARIVLWSVLGVLLLVVSIDFVFAVIGQIKSVRTGYSWHAAILYVLLRMPSDIYLVFPIVGFLGALIGLNILAAKSELIAMRAAGMSLTGMARAMMLTAIGLLIFYYGLSLYVAPYSRHAAIFQQSNASAQNVLVLSSNTWLKSGDHILQVGEVLPEGIMNHVTDFVVTHAALTQIRQIEQIKLISDHEWTLTNVVVTNITANGVTQTRIPSITEPSFISRGLLPVIAMQPDEMTINTLASYIHFRESNRLSVKSYQLQFWNRIIQPLMLPIMMLLAIPFMLGSVRSHSPVRLVIGLFMGFAFYIISQFFSSLTLLSPLPPFLGAAVPIIIFGLLTIILFAYINRR